MSIDGVDARTIVPGDVVHYEHNDCKQALMALSVTRPDNKGTFYIVWLFLWDQSSLDEPSVYGQTIKRSYMNISEDAYIILSSKLLVKVQ